jgi:hypothetical protein
LWFDVSDSNASYGNLEELLVAESEGFGAVDCADPSSVDSGEVGAE